ncbi:MAG: hypothetical protein RLZZ186_988 [Cyanobacteriota bacterium]
MVPHRREGRLVVVSAWGLGLALGTGGFSACEQDQAFGQGGQCFGSAAYRDCWPSPADRSAPLKSGSSRRCRIVFHRFSAWVPAQTQVPVALLAEQSGKRFSP